MLTEIHHFLSPLQLQGGSRRTSIREDFLHLLQPYTLEVCPVLPASSDSLNSPPLASVFGVSHDRLKIEEALLIRQTSGKEDQEILKTFDETMLLGHIFRSEYLQLPLVLVTSLNMLFYVNLSWFCVTAKYFHLSEPNLARSSRSPHADFRARVFTVNTQEASCQNSASVMLACREGLTCAAFFAGISSPFGAISRSFHSLMAANKRMLAWVFQVFVHFWTCENHSLLNLNRPFPFLKLSLCQPHKPLEQQKRAKGRSFLSNYTGWLLVRIHGS